MEEVKVLTTLEEVKAISDPMKYRILMSFYKMEQPATIKQIADSINEVPAKIHYHVKKMEALGVLKLIYTKEIKGIIAKYYEPTAERFDIKCADEAVAPNKKLMMAESQRLISEIYDTSKEIIFEQIEKYSQSNEKSNANVSITDLYMTKEEMSEFTEYIKDFLNKYGDKKREGTDINKYHCFMSNIKIKAD